MSADAASVADRVRSLPKAAWLRSGPAAKLLRVLDTDGEEARVVGGAVRDALLGLEIGEIDIATTALPETVTQRAQAAGFKVAATGVEHGTVSVIVHGIPVEVTTLRADVETYGRRAKVAFGRDWIADAERRDFTMNALSASRTGELFDPVGGLDDLAAGRVRFIGEARQRIREDFLRSLRFFRFHARFGRGEPDRAALDAITAERAGLATLSRERVRTELLKLLTAPHAAETLWLMSERGILVDLIGGVPDHPALRRLVTLETATGGVPDAVRRLGALAVRIAEDADRLRERLRLSNGEHDRLRALAEFWRAVPCEEQAARELLYRARVDRYTDAVLVGWARSGEPADDAEWRALLDLPQRWKPPLFPLMAADLMQRGVPKGPQLGRALRSAEAAWMAAGFPMDPAAIAGMADDAVRAQMLGNQRPA